MLPLQQGCINTDQNANDPQDCQSKMLVRHCFRLPEQILRGARLGMMTTIGKNHYGKLSQVGSCSLPINHTGVRKLS